MISSIRCIVLLLFLLTGYLEADPTTPSMDASSPSVLTDDAIEEVVITSSYIHSSLDEITHPLHVVNGEWITEGATQSLGQALDHLLGVSSSDYGAAVGQPVIRGMLGNRVKVLHNGNIVRDVSSLGADHINDIDLSHVQHIEIVRGPASLFYTHGAIGGIINIVDNAIAKSNIEHPEVFVGGETQSVNDGNAGQLTYRGHWGGLNFSMAYSKVNLGNYDIPSGAVMPVLHDDDEHPDPVRNTLDNSDFEKSLQKGAISKTGSWGYVGISYANSDALYGIPFHVEEEKDHMDMESDDEDHGEERVFIGTDARITTIMGEYKWDSSWIKNVRYAFVDTHYTLAEEETAEISHQTTFQNDGQEFGSIWDMSTPKFKQKITINFTNEDISMIGDEIFIAPTRSSEITWGYYWSKDFPSIHIDGAVRHDRVTRKGMIDQQDFRSQHNNTSVALGLRRNITDHLTATLGVSLVERAPAAVELFINGPHLSTQRFERGHPHLHAERAHNVDLTVDVIVNDFFTTITFFNNEVDNYIYLMDEGPVDANIHPLFIPASYRQQNARLRGYEFELGQILHLAKGELTLSYGRDDVSGTFADGGYIPRLVAARNFYKVAYHYKQAGLKFLISLKDVGHQNKVASTENPTRGYEMLDIRFSKVFLLREDSVGMTLSVYGKNLLNEIARNHTSFVKDHLPLPGRNYGVKLNFKF